MSYQNTFSIFLIAAERRRITLFEEASVHEMDIFDAGSGLARAASSVSRTGPGAYSQNRDFDASRGLMVAFICNHCPFVLHILDEFVSVASDFRARGLATVAISSNDIDAHPEDGPLLHGAAGRR